jgi:competence protein ComEA
VTSTPPAPARLTDDAPPWFGRTTAGDPLEDAVARLHAVREAAAVPTPDVVAADEPPADEAAELAERLRARRSVGHVAAAYSAAHGHALTVADDGPGRRWALAPRTAAVAAVAVLLLGVGAAAVALWPGTGVTQVAALDGGGELAGSTAESSVAPTAAPSGSPTAAAPGEGAVVVHVVGQVADPGLVTLRPGARVADALEGAGGPNRDADLASLNLARTVVDGEQIYVPADGEVAPGPAGTAPAGAAAGAGGVVDLNSADAAALDALPGIGPVLAERIVAWRTDNGPFTSVDELTEVSGIGPAVLGKLRDSVRV